jgi:hypothetical protein
MGQRITAKSCVLAAGGFESNREWLREAWGQNERGEWPADNFIIRGTAFNQGVLLKHMLQEQQADGLGDPTQAHMVAIDARAPLYDGGICTRIDCVSLGVVVNRDAQRFYDEGEDFWPKRYAIWGRLVAQQPGQIGLLHHRQQGHRPLHAAGVPRREGRLPARAGRSWVWTWTPSWPRSTPTTAAARSAISTIPRWTTATPKAWLRPRRTGRARSTPAPTTAMRCAPA